MAAERVWVSAAGTRPTRSRARVRLFRWLAALMFVMIVAAGTAAAPAAVQEPARDRLQVQVSGPAFAYDGDLLTFTYVVSAVGDQPIGSVAVRDSACAEVVGPVSRSNDDGDAVLDPLGMDGQTPETWTYSCQTTAPASPLGAPDIVNTVTATGTDRLETVQAVASWSTRRLHAALSLELTSQSPSYTMTIRNSGDTAIVAASIVVTNDRCTDAPQLASFNGDPTVETLDPGDAWTYACPSAPFDANASSDGIVSVTINATVSARDIHGRSVFDAKRVSFSVGSGQNGRIGSPRPPKLTGPTGCITSTSRATVSGDGIRAVVFSVDGRRAKRLRRPNLGRRWVLRLWPRKLSYGRHQLRARVTLKGTTRSRTLRLRVLRCRDVRAARCRNCTPTVVPSAVEGAAELRRRQRSSAGSPSAPTPR